MKLFAFLSSLVFCDLAAADVNAWLSEVAVGTPATFVESTIVLPALVDIGTIAQTTGATYEFLVNATDDGLSSALMGTRNTGFGDDAAIKFEQYADSGQLGVTLAGVADYFIAPHVVNQDMHVVVLADYVAGTTEFYVDGALVGGAPYAVYLTGDVGLGEWYNATGSPVDSLTGDMLGVATYASKLTPAEIQAHFAAFDGNPGGTVYCSPAVPNNAGMPGRLELSGSAIASNNSLTLRALDLPNNQYAMFINSLTPGSIANPSGSQGILCVIGGIGLYNGPGQLQNTGSAGSISLALDLSQTPTPAGPVSVMAGETWYFQAWYRDWIPAQGPTTNFTDAIEMVFQ